MDLPFMVDSEQLIKLVIITITESILATILLFDSTTVIAVLLLISG